MEVDSTKLLDNTGESEMKLCAIGPCLHIITSESDPACCGGQWVGSGDWLWVHMGESKH